MDDRLAFEVELFADLMVQLDDPFAERESVFIAAGLDEGTYRRLLQNWRVRFDHDAGAALASRFADRYAARRAAVLEARGREARGEVDANDARFLNADVQSFREEAAKVAREPLTMGGDPPYPPARPVAEEVSSPPAPEPAESPPPAAPPRDLPSFVLAAQQAAAPAPAIALAPVVARPPASLVGTMDISHAVPRASLPFAPASEPRAAEPAPASVSRPHVPTGTADISAFVPRAATPFSDGATPRPPPAPAISPPVARPPQRLAGTADISDFVPRAATPFAPPPAPPAPAPAPRKRLIRFDPQTGQPLPAPIWVDLPPEPEGQKK